MQHRKLLPKKISGTSFASRKNCGFLFVRSAIGSVQLAGSEGLRAFGSRIGVFGSRGVFSSRVGVFGSRGVFGSQVGFWFPRGGVFGARLGFFSARGCFQFL